MPESKIEKHTAKVHEPSKIESPWANVARAAQQDHRTNQQIAHADLQSINARFDDFCHGHNYIACSDIYKDLASAKPADKAADQYVLRHYNVIAGDDGYLGRDDLSKALTLTNDDPNNIRGLTNRAGIPPVVGFCGALGGGYLTLALTAATDLFSGPIGWAITGGAAIGAGVGYEVGRLSVAGQLSDERKALIKL